MFTFQIIHFKTWYYGFIGDTKNIGHILCLFFVRIHNLWCNSCPRKSKSNFCFDVNWFNLWLECLAKMKQFLYVCINLIFKHFSIFNIISWTSSFRLIILLISLDENTSTSSSGSGLLNSEHDNPCMQNWSATNKTMFLCTLKRNIVCESKYYLFVVYLVSSS